MIPPLLDEAELQKLIALAQDGDTDAFGRIYDHFFTPVYRYCAFRLPVEVAEDTTADIFVKAWEKIHTYKAQRGVPFAAWIFRIARYSVIDTYRSARGFDEVPEDIPDLDNFNRTEGRAERNDTLRIVRHALDQLPTRYREILLLTYVSDLPYSEVARVLHMTAGGVRILKLRALRKLESLLPPEIVKDS
ncbi:sigma-70 family RNA polymerase sigma factor [Candidatus Peribacteria bacterium]|nr:MAG: sigma-70 family RNA polymerase sigma factor [Candidatus Peribacteria bacterium]